MRTRRQMRNQVNQFSQGFSSLFTSPSLTATLFPHRRQAPAAAVVPLALPSSRLSRRCRRASSAAVTAPLALLSSRLSRRPRRTSRAAAAALSSPWCRLLFFLFSSGYEGA
ncbi:hypothetical protein U1Q18_019672 [Sarracenia purpurea var. burkii]